MSRYLIELPHADDYVACVKALQALQRTGSHFVTHAEWGCGDGVHVGFLMAEVADRSQALQIVPLEFRQDARITRLDKYTREQIAGMVAEPQA